MMPLTDAATTAGLIAIALGAIEAVKASVARRNATADPSRKSRDSIMERLGEMKQELREHNDRLTDALHSLSLALQRAESRDERIIEQFTRIADRIDSFVSRPCMIPDSTRRKLGGEQ